MTGRTRRADLRMLGVAVVAWAAGLLAIFADDAAPLAVALWIGAAGTLVATRRWRRLAIVAVCLACAAAVCSHVAIAASDRATLLSLPHDGGRALVIEATVTGKVERGAGGWRFDAVTETVAVGDETHRVGAPIVVRAATRPEGLDLGARVTVNGSGFAADRGDRAVLVVDAGEGMRVRRPPTGALAVAASLRLQLLARTDGLPQPGAGLIAGLAVGDTARLDPDLDADMKTASLSHLTAVSGANCALVVGLAYGAAALAGLRRGMRVVCGLVALVGFVVLVSPEPSVVRAAAMAAIAMLAVLLGRSGAGAALLGCAVTACLIADPWLAATLGFALSAAATSALLLIAAPMAAHLARAMPRPLALALAVPLSAQIACTPLLVAIDPRLPVWAVLANILAAPAAPAATVVGLAACLAAPVPLLASGLAALAWIPCAWIAATAETAARLPLSSVPWITGGTGAAAAVILCTAAVLTLLPTTPRRLRVVAASLVCGVVGVIAGGLALDGPVARATAPQDWSIAACDVGQGDALLLRSAETIALVDTGPDQAALETCLELFGVDRIDLLVLTHFDLDHRGGVEAVLGRTATLVHGPPAGPDDDRVLATFAASGTRTVQAHAGMTGRLGDATWTALWPRAMSGADDAGNDASVVVDIRGGGMPTALLLGDLSASPQQALRGRVDGPYDVVKVAHHGSADQDVELYRRASPAVAIVPVGDNDYGHPRREILDAVTSLGATVVRTDLDGAAAVSARDGTLLVWRQRPPDDVDDAG